MDSFQITTSPLLRQFATRLDPRTIQVTTKLGVATIIRADFDPVSFPADEDLQEDFLRDLINRANPGALELLNQSLGKCLGDQAKAIRQVLGSGTSETGRN
ncbi:MULTISPECIES: hypothetical protein [Pseudomonas]|jgi:hypothetical protein|uniref:Uncharacterized protein n=6 Tax=Pseudomonas TaxID=286 RepID=A0A1V0M5W8_PSEAI|nr:MULTISPECIES: hypothetical protein [Pseudomonas]AVX92537.1 hypothetical protein PkP19E3_30575 [Pseudomonas koreensis]MDU7557466.1 hypothetical protein [Pseudomonas sp.]WQN30138.1 hypothetical protein ULE26_21465 [Stutzerimonas stutzeri]AGL46122.1 hypothetical protein pOZ176_158 [Pseudomonas aeruginosa PA96]ARD70296.1 Hypothetical protein [Pseudomonas aeruginosa]